MSLPLIPIISNYIFLIHVYLLIKEHFIQKYSFINRYKKHKQAVVQ